MQKGAEAFRSIGEVASLIGVAPHVLRYWETQFAQLKPMKRADGGAIIALRTWRWPRASACCCAMTG